MAGCFDFLNQVYGVFGFDFHLKLSTRPENYIGELSVWDNAEKVITYADWRR
jgi:threonyl-tRNA synthetase